jgi:hypothetical protein
MNFSFRSHFSTKGSEELLIALLQQKKRFLFQALALFKIVRLTLGCAESAGISRMLEALILAFGDADFLKFQPLIVHLSLT